MLHLNCKKTKTFCNLDHPSTVWKKSSWVWFKKDFQTKKLLQKSASLDPHSKLQSLFVVVISDPKCTRTKWERIVYQLFRLPVFSCVWTWNKTENILKRVLSYQPANKHSQVRDTPSERNCCCKSLKLIIKFVDYGRFRDLCCYLDVRCGDVLKRKGTSVIAVVGRRMWFSRRLDNWTASVWVLS